MFERQGEYIVARTKLTVRRKKTFEASTYQARLRIIRAIVSDGNASALAKHLGIEPKRWANYERGKPMSREVAFIIWEKLDLSPDWVWFGEEGNLTDDWKHHIKQVEAIFAKHRETELAFERVKQRRKKDEQERRQIIQSWSFSADGKPAPSKQK